MPSVLFIGGPLDGQLRAVPEGDDRVRCPVSNYLAIRPADVFAPPPYMNYRIANGIARAEDMTEEQVAQRLAAVYSRARNLKFLEDALVERDRLLENGWDKAAELMRRLIDSVAYGKRPNPRTCSHEFDPDSRCCSLCGIRERDAVEFRIGRATPLDEDGRSRLRFG